MTRSLNDPDFGTSNHELSSVRKGIVRIRHELKEGSSLGQCGHRPQHVYPPLLALIVTLLLRTTLRNESVLLLDERQSKGMVIVHVGVETCLQRYAITLDIVLNGLALHLLDGSTVQDKTLSIVKTDNVAVLVEIVTNECLYFHFCLFI